MSGQVTRCGTCRTHDLPCGAGVHRNPLMRYLELLPTTHVTPDMADTPAGPVVVPVIVPCPRPPDPRAAAVAHRHERAARRATLTAAVALGVLLLAALSTAIVLPLLVLYTSAPLP